MYTKIINNKEDIEKKQFIKILLFILIIGLIFGSGLLGVASILNCGITVKTSEVITSERIGTVFNSSIQEQINNNITNYIFNNYLTLSKQYNFRSKNIINDTCFLTVYNGKNYSLGQKNLFPNNHSLVTYYDNNIGECYFDPQTQFCDNTITIVGIVFLSFSGAIIVIFIGMYIFVKIAPCAFESCGILLNYCDESFE